MTPHRIRVAARAKLTLSLHVDAARSDGYHELEALTVSLVDPHDVLTVELHPGGRGVDLTTAGIAFDLGEGVDDLVERSVRRFAAHVDLHDGVAVRLHKAIAPGAGLGGGSADAAATLVALRALAAPDLDDDALRALGAPIGSDVPFCVRGGAAWMRGRGEVLEPVEPPPITVVVVTPPVHCSTADVYRRWDELGGPRGREVPAPPALRGLLDELRNDLEPAAEAVEPRLASVRAALEAATGRAVVLAGSGSSYAVLGPEARVDALDAVVAAAHAAVPGARVHAAAVASRGVEVL